MEIFWRTIAYYNSATWLFQIVIILIGIALTGLLIGKPRPWVKMAMKFYMIGLYTWISLVYYYIYCEERSYNGVMAMFWGVMAIIWIWDAITGYTTFEHTHKYDLLSYVLLAMPFIYPLVSLARGLSFPEMTKEQRLSYYTLWKSPFRSDRYSRGRSASLGIRGKYCRTCGRWTCQLPGRRELRTYQRWESGITDVCSRIREILGNGNLCN